MSIVFYCPENCNPNNYGSKIFNANLHFLQKAYEICSEFALGETYFIHNKKTSLFLPGDIDILFTIAGLPNWMFDRENYKEAIMRAKTVVWIIDGAETEKMKGGSALDKRFCELNKNNLFTYHFFYEGCKHSPAIEFPWGFFNDFWPRKERIEPKAQGLVYYGNYRDERVQSFQKYLQYNYPTHFVGSPRYHLNFRDLNPNANFFDRLPFSALRIFPSTLYIIDDDLLKVNIPTARYFEAISLGIFPFIDGNAIANFSKLPESYIDEQIVFSHKDIKSKLKHIKELRAKFLDKHKSTNYYEIAEKRLIKLVRDIYENQ